MALLNQGELDILHVYFKGGTPPSKFYLGLAYSTVAITEGATLAGISEVTDGGYARQEITFSDPTIDANGDTVIANASTIEFGPFENNLAATVEYGFVTDAQTGTDGKLIIAKQLSTTWKAPSNGIITFPAGNLKFKLD